ncbi:MAG TPA: LPS export ABC transporter ATP-binding protein [Verrucomicrobiales bacterium]|jgi:lipopolysaccharide export system ATP-binding protein|nr:LPS export ABC transporter ATP-binding protein [Verrucomicrobiales bacterium]
MNTPKSKHSSKSTKGSRRNTPTLLESQGLMKSYGGRTVVNDVHISVREGEIVGLLGPNGAGKTTSFYMIAGLIPADAGIVKFGGENISSLPMHKRARIGMGYLPQEESIFRHLSVEENLLAVLETRRDLSRKERLEKTDSLLERFNISKLRKSEALSLSGGEKRRLTIARSLCTDPSLLMLDEPFSGVDPIAVGDIQNIVRDLRDDDGLSILITDHNVRETLGIVDHAYLLHEGQLILQGEADEIADDPIARKHYLGDDFVL